MAADAPLGTAEVTFDLDGIQGAARPEIAAPRK
ncbi:hypothetical protein FHS40_007039 [Streptomyces spectabilis]|uniref:Uncharacterized protein n=1 Tax=Streptomyces spectabilis TaxID=68270 RepID=A0A7W8B3F3_STRST|nr:hypothetical protein [Streptomyces spectabilis]